MSAARGGRSRGSAKVASRPSEKLTALLAAIESGDRQPAYVVTGDSSAAEKEAEKIAAALASSANCEVHTFRRPPSLSPLLADLQTFAMFEGAKVSVVIDSAVFADRSVAADLIDAALKELESGSADQPAAASRLVLVLKMFALDIDSGEPAELLAQLPPWVFQGGKSIRRSKPRGRTKKQINEILPKLGELISVARQQGMQGVPSDDASELGAMLERGLPPNHALVLAEDAFAADHPVLQVLEGLGSVIHLPRVASTKDGGWEGLDAVVAGLQSETGVAIERQALAELARRTLRQKGEWRQRRVDSESTARFAAEYRKLALSSANGRIGYAEVEGSVSDRGEEDVWKILDSVGSGNGNDAIRRYRRLIASAADATGARLSFFSLLAGFCRQAVAIRGLVKLRGLSFEMRGYPSFRDRLAPQLQQPLPGGFENPLKGLHAYRLFKAYSAAAAMDEQAVDRFLWWLLETEMRIKGEVSDADLAIEQLIAKVTTARRSKPRGRRPSRVRAR